MKIWVDDIRTPPNGWLWCKSSAQAIDFLSDIITQRAYYDKPDLFRVDVMSLDHDLGGDDTSRPIVLWMCENDFWPGEVRVHSQNPIGVTWLQGMIDRYHPTNAHRHFHRQPDTKRGLSGNPGVGLEPGRYEE